MSNSLFPTLATPPQNHKLYSKKGPSYAIGNIFNLLIVLTIGAFGIFSEAFAVTGTISRITLREAFKRIRIAAILTSRIQIRNPKFKFR